MNRADYEVGTLESKVELEVNNAIKSLDNLISKIDNVKSVLSSALNINGIKEITQFTNSINKIPNALNEINKVDMTKVDSQFTSLGNTVTSFTTQLKEANTMANSTQTVLQNVISSFNALPSAMSKVEKIDNRQLYSSLSSTSRATGEFSGSLYTSLSNIPQALKEVQNMDLKSLYNSFDSMTRILEPFTIKMNETFKGMTDTITPFIDKVKELNDELGKMSGLSDEIGDNAEKSITKTNKVINESNKQNKKINFRDAVKSTIKLGAIYGVLRKGFNTVKDITSANIDMIETTNLFEVQMGKVVDEYGNLDEAQSQYYTKAMAFQDKMNEKLATNKSEMQKYQAMYYGMLNAQLGAENRDASYMMSESLTKAGYDIASLYNLDVETAMNKLKSGLAGQIESLRQIGIDVSEASLSRILDQVGIERSVQQLSYAEKEVARYIAICQQAGQAQGDFARTFEQPANQLRVFKNQLIELKQVAGSFFVGLFGQIMPVINGIIMAIKEILKALGAVFGFEVDVGNSSLGTVSDTVRDIGSGLGNATKKAKEFKKQLMGFDEINNITPPSESSGGSGGGGAVSGIDSALLDALKEWDNKMDSISGKAQGIRDKMLDWLGFVRNDDGTWRLGEGLTNFEKILDIVKTIGIAIGTWKVASTVTNLLKKLGIFGTGDLANQKAFKLAFGITLTLTGVFLLYKGISHILEGNVDIFTILETALGGAMTTFGIVSILKGVSKTMSLGSAFKIGFGLTLALTGLFMEYNSAKKILEGDVSLGNMLKATGSAFLIGLGTWLLTGSITAGLIGTASALAINLAFEITAIITGTDKVDIQVSNLKDTIDDLTTSLKEHRDSYDNTVKSIKDTWEQELIEADYAKKLADQLDNLVDANGRVKAGNEDRVKFILNELNDALGTEYELNDNLITKNGEVIKSYEDLQESIADTIEAKKKEAEKEAVTELYKESIKEQIQAEKDLQKSKETTAKAFEEYNTMMAKGYDPWVMEHDEACQEIMQNMIDTQQIYAETEQAYKEATDNVTYYNQEMTDNIIENTGVLTSEMVTQGQVSGKKLQTMLETQTEKWEDTYSKLDETQQSAMLAQSTTLDKWSPTIQQKWADMANNSSKSFLNGIASVDTDTAKKILSTVTTTNNLNKDMVVAWAKLAMDSNKDFNEALESIPDDVKGKILTSIACVDELNGTARETYRNLSENAKMEFKKAMESLDEDAKAKVLASIVAVEGLTEKNKNTYQNLSETAKQAFNNSIASLDEDTKGKVLASIIAVEGLNDRNKDALENLGEQGIQAFNQAMYSMDTDARDKVQSAINEISSKSWEMYNESYNTANEGRKGAQAGSESNGGSSQIGNWFVQGLLNALTWGKSSIWQAGYNLVKSAINGGNNAQQTGSPAKETIKMGNFFTEGYIVGLKKKQEEVRKTTSGLVGIALGEFKELNQGIKINTKDFAVDTNQYVNYSAIKGKILAQSQISMNDNIADKIAGAVAQSLRNTEVNVNIEARADEGVIFKKVQNSAREYTMQTGEPAFEY